MEVKLLHLQCMDQLDCFESCQDQVDVLVLFLLSAVEDRDQDCDQPWPDRLEHFVQGRLREAHEEDPDAEEHEDQQGLGRILLLHHIVQKQQDSAELVLILVYFS